MMIQPFACLLALSVLLSGISAAQGPGSGHLAAKQQAPPSIRSDLGSARKVLGEALRFQVTVAGRAGSRVSLKVLAAPAGMILDPLVEVPSPATLQVRWDQPYGQRHRIVLEADDGSRSTQKTLEFELSNPAGFSKRGDVTGDGIPDLVAGSREVDGVGLPVLEDTGAIYVFAGDAEGLPGATPIATLRVADAREDDRHGSFLLGDVSGDGILDVVGFSPEADFVVSDPGAIYVWLGGEALVGERDRDARLEVPGAAAKSFLGSAGRYRLLDFTGDGVLDVLAAGDNTSGSGITFPRAIHCWAGGGTFSGSMAPTSSLVPPVGSVGDMFSTSGQGWVLDDVTGDGQKDLLVGAYNAGSGGELYVWKGGPGLGATQLPHAVLTVSAGQADDMLGKLSRAFGGLFGNGMRTIDLDQDGVLDVMALAPFADRGAVVDQGAIYIWKGGDALQGIVEPQVILSDPSVTYLGACDRRNAVLSADVTGDGRLNVVAGSTKDDGLRGSISVFDVDLQGAPSSPSPRATLRVPGANAGDGLLNTDGSQPLLLVDLSGDGVLDLLALAQFADSPSGTDSGAIYAWLGGAALAGNLGPTRSLFVQDAFSFSELGNLGGFQGLHAVDVTGDGRLDVVAGTAVSSGIRNGTQNGSGSVHCWKNGPQIGIDPPLTMRLSNAGFMDRLGGSGLHFGDLDGDGALDIVAASDSSMEFGVNFSGGIYVWTGVKDLEGIQDPSARLTIDGVAPFDRLTFGDGVSLQLADVSGDGDLDVIALARSASGSGSGADDGALFVFEGGAVAGNQTESRRLEASVPGANIGGIGGMRLLDLNADGVLDMLQGDVALATSRGGFFCFLGGALAPDFEVRSSTVPGASPGDRLGFQ